MHRRWGRWCSVEGVCQLAWSMDTAGVRHEQLLLRLLKQVGEAPFNLRRDGLAPSPAKVLSAIALCVCQGAAQFSSVKNKHFSALLCSLADLRVLELAPVDPGLEFCHSKDSTLDFSSERFFSPTGTVASTEVKKRVFLALLDEFERRVQVVAKVPGEGLRGEDKILSLFETARCLRALSSVALFNAESSMQTRQLTPLAASSAQAALSVGRSPFLLD